jgi:integrase
MGVLVREIPKRSRTWYVKVNYRGERRAKKFGKKEEAEAYARKLRDRIADGEFNLPPKEEENQLTFGQYAEKWIEGHVRNNLKPRTAEGYRANLARHIFPDFEHRPLAAITREDIKALCHRKLESGRIKPRKLADGTMERSLSRKSVSQIARILGSLFSHAVEDGAIKVNPAEKPGRYIKTTDRKEKSDFLTPEEGKILLDSTKTHFPRFHPLLLAALRTGMRKGELLGVKWGDVDWIGKFIEVKRTKWKNKVFTPKSGKSRRVDMSDQLAAILTDHRRKMATEALADGRPLPEWVFVSPVGTPLDESKVSKEFKRCLAKAGLRHIRFHDLRHSFASFLLSNGESLTYVRDQLGHSSIGITADIYGHLVPGANQRAVNALDDPEWMRKAVGDGSPAQVERKTGEAESPNPLISW